MNLQTSANICAQTSTNALVHDTEHDTEHENEVDAAPSGAPPSLDDLNSLEDEVANLKGWGAFTMDDRAWLEEMLGDFKGTLASDIRDCRDYWLAKAKTHTKKQWKSRLRNWLSHKVEWRKDGAIQGRARAVPAKYSDPPTYTRPLTKVQPES